MQKFKYFFRANHLVFVGLFLLVFTAFLVFAGASLVAYQQTQARGVQGTLAPRPRSRPTAVRQLFRSTLFSLYGSVTQQIRCLARAV